MTFQELAIMLAKSGKCPSSTYRQVQEILGAVTDVLAENIDAEICFTEYTSMKRKKNLKASKAKPVDPRFKL